MLNPQRSSLKVLIVSSLLKVLIVSGLRFFPHLWGSGALGFRMVETVGFRV